MLTRSAFALCVVWCCACDSEEPLDLCATLPLRRGEVTGFGSVRLKTAGVEAATEEVRIGSGDGSVVVKFCEVHKGRRSAAFLAWSRDPQVALPAPIRLFNDTELNPRPIDGIHGSWKSCNADDCTVDNGSVHFESWLLGGARNASGEITAWDTRQARIAAWATFDTEVTTYCDESGNSSRGPCDEVCGAFDDPCRHDIGDRIEIDVDVAWTPPGDAGVGDDDGGA